MAAIVTQPAVFYLGALLLAAAAVQWSHMGWSAYQRRAVLRQRHLREKQQFIEQIALTLRAVRATDARRAGWQGVRRLVVSAIVDETHDARSFYLVDPDEHPLPAYEPGQYLTLHLPIGAAGKALVRCYSLSDRWRAEYYRLTIKRCPAPRDMPAAPAGRASNWMHDHVGVGTSLDVAAPTGGFFLDPRQQEPVVLIAGGVGITPLYSMLAELAQRSDLRRVWLFYGMRSGGDFIFREAIADLVREHPHVQCRVAMSAPREVDQLEHDYHHRGRLSAEWISQQLPSGKYRYYLCGPGGMMQSLVVGLLEQGISDDMIHFEAFGPASVRPRPSQHVAEPVQVRFAKHGDACDWTGQYASLLELAEAHGIEVDFGCRAGNCGQCAVDVVEGSIETLRRPGCQVGEGQCLLCISTPKSPIVLEV